MQKLCFPLMKDPWVRVRLICPLGYTGPPVILKIGHGYGTARTILCNKLGLQAMFACHRDPHRNEGEGRFATDMSCVILPEIAVLISGGSGLMSIEPCAPPACRHWVIMLLWWARRRLEARRSRFKLITPTSSSWWGFLEVVEILRGLLEYSLFSLRLFFT